MNKEKTDEKVAEILDALHTLKLENPAEKEKLIRNFNSVIDQLLLDGKDTDYLIYQSEKRKKNITLATICFIVGLLVAFIPILMYTSSLKANITHEYHFVANSIGYPKPQFVEMIKTQEQLDVVKKSNIRDASHEASLGAIVKLSSSGLEVLSKQEVSSPEYHLKKIKPQKDKMRTINNYKYIPDYLLIKDPRYIEIISAATVQTIRYNKNILEREMAEVGAGVYCPKKAKCFVIPKANLEHDYSKVDRTHS